MDKRKTMALLLGLLLGTQSLASAQAAARTGNGAARPYGRRAGDRGLVRL